MRWRIRGGLALACAIAGLGCYDSQWGAGRRAQAHGAAIATPATLAPSGLESEDGRSITVPVKTYRVRAYATSRYAGQTVDWKHEILELIAQSNQVLTKMVGVRLEVISTDAWAPGAEDDLDVLLKQLQKNDPGNDADWVLGFVNALPTTTTSFHQLGMANVLGKHIVMRGAGVLGERDQIEEAFDQLDPETRTRLAKQRKAHRAESVFLHELGHTLGAVHETARESIMHPAYDPRMSGYTTEALSLMVPALAGRGLTSVADASALRKDLLAALRGSRREAWIPVDREQMVEDLEAASAAAPAPSPAQPPSASPPDATRAATPSPPSELSPAEQETFTRAYILFRDSKPDDAWEIATPLFSRYIAVYAVQDLRCQLASARGLPFSQTRAECDPLMKLSLTPAQAKRP